jgi:hypothetical protein
MPTTDELARQINVLNSAVHVLCAVLTAEQQARASVLLAEALQRVQANLESSAASDEELSRHVELQASLLKALRFPSSCP